MYKVIKINDSVATRTVELLNEATGTKDICFDDSALVSIDNFEFMEQGKSYNCKIKLFGQLSEEKAINTVECKILNREITIGNRELVEVLVNEDIYYLYKSKVVNVIDKDRFFFNFTRKDLIQVDNVIHNDLMR